MTKKEMARRIADLEEQVARLAAQPRETHVHVTPALPAFPPNPYVFPQITCGDHLTTDIGPLAIN